MSINIQYGAYKNHDIRITSQLSMLFDYKNGISNSTDFLSLYYVAPNSVTEYGATSARAFFSEAGAMYIHEPQLMKRRNNNLYNYFDALYGPYMKQ